MQAVMLPVSCTLSVQGRVSMNPFAEWVSKRGNLVFQRERRAQFQNPGT